MPTQLAIGKASELKLGIFALSILHVCGVAVSHNALMAHLTCMTKMQKSCMLHAMVYQNWAAP